MQDQEFFDVADQFINLANELTQDHGSPRISAALLFAASRFNAHNFYATDGEGGNRKTAVKYLCAQYKEMLSENLETIAHMYQED
jgi:hypothetical protein